MSDDLLLLLSDYGAAAIFVATCLSCLALPVPTSLFMLTAGAFIASGDLGPTSALAAAWGGAILGDQIGFGIGRRGAGPLVTRIEADPRRAALVARTRAKMNRWGGPGVFLTRWLFSPLGPYVNLIGGATGYNWRRFTLWAIAGETVWVAIYTGLGYLFSDRIIDLATILSNAVGFLVAALIALIIGRQLLRRVRAAQADA